MAALANQAIGAQQTPRYRWRQICLAEVHAIGIHRKGNVEPVVNNKKSSIAVA
jgi:hypothetical protein